MKKWEVPYHVGILSERGLWCGGVLYSADTVISAASCFRKENLSNYLFFTGKYNLWENNYYDYEQLSFPISITKHPSYKESEGYYDVAVIKLETPFCLNDLTQSLPLSKSGFQPTGNCNLLE